jgi:hypothetical protein
MACGNTHYWYDLTTSRESTPSARQLFTSIINVLPLGALTPETPRAVSGDVWLRFPVRERPRTPQSCSHADAPGLDRCATSERAVALLQLTSSAPSNRSSRAPRSGEPRERKTDICPNEQQRACPNGKLRMREVFENTGAGEGNRTLVFSLEVVNFRNPYNGYSNILQPSGQLRLLENLSLSEWRELPTASQLSETN